MKAPTLAKLEEDQRALVKAAMLLTKDHPDLADEIIKIKVRYQVVARKNLGI